MSIVQKITTHNLQEQDYTNVYGSSGMPISVNNDDWIILPIGPTDPVKTAVPLNQQPFHSRIFCG